LGHLTRNGWFWCAWRTAFHAVPTPLQDGTKSKRILIMMSNTGGGHRASAEAIKEAMHEKYGSSYEVRINGWPLVPCT
jgi:predicted Ser/Thr protein kinase